MYRILTSIGHSLVTLPLQLVAMAENIILSPILANLFPKIEKRMGTGGKIHHAQIGIIHFASITPINDK